MKRYDLDSYNDYAMDGTPVEVPTMREKPEGEWVKYEDAEKLRAMLEGIECNDEDSDTAREIRHLLWALDGENVESRDLVYYEKKHAAESAITGRECIGMEDELRGIPRE